MVRLGSADGPSDGKKDVRILEVTVTDTGKGISSDYLRTRLFTPFSQEDVLASGTGLGLSIVRSIVTMLEGSIDVKSQVGHGTEVKIEIPLMRELVGTNPVSTPSSVGSPDKLQDNSISTLQTDYPTKTVSLFVDDFDRRGRPEHSETCKVAMSYIEHWYKLPIKPRQVGTYTDIVIVEELYLASLLKQIDHLSSIVVLCNTTHRQQVAESLYPGAIEFISTPFGPYRLAKAVRLVLEKAKRISDGTTSTMYPTSHSPRCSEPETVVPEFDSMTLESEETPIRVQTNGRVTASHSSNARKALGSDSSGGSSEIRDDFPFPVQESLSSSSLSPRRPYGDLTRQTSTRPKLTSRRTEPTFRPPFPYSSAFTHQGALAVSDARGVDPASLSPRQTPVSQPEVTKEPLPPEPPSISKEADRAAKRPPRILLVEDNQINLRLLRTFMHKRKYEHVESAENGQLALEAAKRHNFDIIFMVR